MTGKSDICAQVRKSCDLLDLESVLPDTLKQAEIDAHLLRCQSCQSWIENWKLISQCAKEIEMVDPPEYLTLRIMDKIDELDEPVPVYKDMTFAIAAFICALAAAFWIGGQEPGELESWSLCFALLVIAQRFLHLRAREDLA